MNRICISCLAGMTFGLVLLMQPCAAQISGTVTDADAGPVPYANVLLLHAADSSLAKGAIATLQGDFSIAAPDGLYILEVTQAGFQRYLSGAFELKSSEGGKALGQLVLAAEEKLLDAVDIVAKRQLYEQKIDRMVVNVAGSITAAGSTALEVLERSPGVIVNRQSNGISLSGKEGVVVMINGKINRIPLAAVVQMLDGMPASNIEKIELITTPPADFDAEGNAGYINIVIKKTNDRGLNGSYSLSGGYGRGSTASAGTNFNFRQKFFNIYGNYSFGRIAQEQLFEFDRMLSLNGDLIGTDTRSYRDPIQRNHDARLGIDLELSKKTVLGLMLSGYDNRWSMDALNISSITRNGLPDTLLSIANDEVNHWKHFGGNLNLQHTFSEGTTLSFDADVLRYDNTNPTNYLVSYADGTGLPLFSQKTFSGKLTPIEVEVGKLDFSRRFSDKFKMEAGIKGTQSRFTNDVTVSRDKNGVPVNDPSLTANYKLKEYIGAAYTAFDLKLDAKTDIKLGLRYEYTDSNLGTEQQANIVDRQYGNFFPSFFVSRNFTDDRSANFSYSRRITRPTFNDMAPFVIFVDPYTFFSGNAALQPSISNNFKVDYRYKTVMASVSYSIEDSAIANFQIRTIPGTNQQLLAAENMKSRQTAALTLSFPVKLTKWWSMQNNLTGALLLVDTYVDNSPVRVNARNFQLVNIQRFDMPRNFSAEIVASYRSRGLFGRSVSLPIGGINVGVQKKLKNNRGNLRAGVDDVLNSFVFGGEVNLPEFNLISNARIDFSQRTYKLTYSRNFGNNELKSARQRATGAEEERRRVN